MKRAIIWLGCGDRFVEEAIASARSAADVAADRILIIDEAGAAAAMLLADDAFTSITTIEPVYGNRIEKSRLIDVLPVGDAVFLLLDADLRIRGDVALGFEKAERHGIALALAPGANADALPGFQKVMADAGIEARDQALFDSSVMFFRLTPSVKKVLEKWRDLCATVGTTVTMREDWPFLNVALEQVGVAPYVLSPLYNDRSADGCAAGRIRVEHGQSLPAPDVVGDPALRLPQPMLEVAMSHALQATGKAEAVVRETLALARRHGSRLAIDFLLGCMGICCTADHPDSYFTEALDYHLGLLEAYALNPEAMSRHLTLSRTMPTGEGNRLFSDHVNASFFVQAQQQRAIARGIPSILVASMPRSASATLTHTLAHALDIPVMHLSVGAFPDLFLCPPWLDVFLTGGALTHDHFGASDFNAGVLRERAFDDLFVLVRDPRAAARSQVHFAGPKDYDLSERISLERRIERECVTTFIPWLQGWIDCSKAADLPFRIHWITCREVCDDLAGVCRRISRILADRHPALAAYAERRDIAEIRIHFVTGNDYAWKAEIGDEIRDRLWAACTPEIRALLDLER